MKNLGRHYIWLKGRGDLTIRTIFEENGKTFIKFQHRIVNVTYDQDTATWTAEVHWAEGQ